MRPKCLTNARRAGMNLDLLIDLQWFASSVDNKPRHEELNACDSAIQNKLNHLIVVFVVIVANRCIYHQNSVHAFDFGEFRIWWQISTVP